MNLVFVSYIYYQKMLKGPLIFTFLKMWFNITSDDLKLQCLIVFSLKGNTISIEV